MGKTWNCLTVTIVSLTMLALLAPAIKAYSMPLVCIVGNDALLNALEPSLNLYSEDLAREGLRTKIVAFNEGNCTDLKALITNEFSTGLVGCLFIGDLPVAYYEDRQVHNETYPCDLYFEDLDGTWIDADHNGKFENHTDGIGGNRSPEIWVGRLKVPVPYGMVLDEVSLLKKYFDRNHAYRTGILGLPNRALLYIDDPWSPQKDTLDSAISAAFSNRTVVYDKTLTNPQDYLNRLTQGWKLVELVAHGGGESHAFYVNDTYFGSVTRKDIREVGPKAFFYTLGSCLCSDFDFFNDYIAGSYVFFSNYSLALLGITDDGLLWNLTDFYSSFSTETLGRSVIRAFENWITQEDAGSWYNFADFYGATVIGDPTLRLNVTEVPLPPVYDVAIIALNSSTNTVFPEDTITIALTVKNNGTARNEDFSVMVYWGEFLIETRQVLGLAPASTETLNIAWTIPYGFNGTHRIWANATLTQDDTNLNNNRLDDGILNVIPKTHDVAVTSVNQYRTVVGNGTLTSIKVTATNEGNVAETVNVTLSHNSAVVGTQAIALNNSSSTTLSFSWNTTDFPLGNCTLTAEVSQVPGETDTSDNSTPVTIQVSIMGDINGDGKVDMKDVSKVAAGFQLPRSNPKWASNGDLDENGVIDMKDISTIAKHFGEYESNIQGTQSSLTILAWTDASFSFGSSKWMFLYQPSFGSTHEVNLDFPFPYFSVNPSEAERLQGEPILITACTTTGQNEMEGRLLNATLEASYTWNGLEITVSEANPAYVVLSFKSLI